MVTLQSASEISRALIFVFLSGHDCPNIFCIYFRLWIRSVFLIFFILSYLRLPNIKRWILLFTHIAALIAILFHFNHFDKLTYAFIIYFRALCTWHNGIRRKAHASWRPATFNGVDGVLHQFSGWVYRISG